MFLINEGWDMYTCIAESGHEALMGGRRSHIAPHNMNTELPSLPNSPLPLPVFLLSPLSFCLVCCSPEDECGYAMKLGGGGLRLSASLCTHPIAARGEDMIR